MIGKIISHYKILEKLGEGGMGVVYKAEDTKLDRLVALKFLPTQAQASTAEKARFLLEAKAASALQHDNICTIYEINETQDRQMFIAMACYEGETLKEVIGKGELAIGKVIDVGVQMAAGLKEAHDKGIIHRDIKPANIMITNKEEVKIMDFGLAKQAGQMHATKAGTTVGTAAYMSPEQARGEEVDQRTDIWSLGVVFYEMLTGRLPFNGEYEQAVVYSILNEEPEPVTALRKDIPIELKLLVEKSLQKECGKRYRFMSELLTELGSLKKKIESENDKNILDRKSPLPSIAVLPFVNMSSDPENEYFSDGLAEELINALSKLNGLHVTARTSTFRFRGKDLDIREIGLQLNVSTVLEGGVRKTGNRLRITTQLINTADGYHLWSEKYDRELGDVLAVQDDISLAIVAALRVKLLGEEREKLVIHYTDNLEAYDLYLKGRYYLNIFSEEGIRKSLEYFQQALLKDPHYAPAHVGIAGGYFALAVSGRLPSKEAVPKAKSELLRALEMDDSLAEAHAWLGDLYLQYDWDWSSAERELKRAIELKPNSPEAHQFYSDYLSTMGRLTEAVAEAERARELDPLSVIAKTILIWQLYASRQFDSAIEHCREALRTEPSFLIQLHLWRALRLNNKLDEAWEECHKLFTSFISRDIGEAMERSYKKSGYRDAMRAAAQALAMQIKTQYGSLTMIATLFTHAEDDDQTFYWLERACEERDHYFFTIRSDPDWDRVRSNPRFTALLDKLGSLK